MLSLIEAKYFVPKDYYKVIENYELLGITKAQANIYSKIYGLEKVPIAKYFTIFDLLKFAIIQLLKNLSLAEKQNIKYLVYTHTAQIIEPFGQSLLDQVKYELGLVNTLAFGISMNKCVSTITSFEISEILLKEEADNVSAIIITGDIAFTKALRLVPNTSIVGDAAAAALVARSGDKNILLASANRTYGKFSKGVWLSPEDLIEFENNYLQYIAKIISEVLRKASLSLEKISLILPHNINIPSWQKVATLLKFPLSKIYLKNVKHTAHCFGTDMLINYVSAVNESLLKRGDYYLMVTVGLGATFSAAVFQY